MKNLLQKLKKDVSKSPVIFKFDKSNRWFEFHLSLTPDGKPNLFLLRNPTFWKTMSKDNSITVEEAFKIREEHYKDLETFKRAYYKLYEKEPPVYIAEEVMESVRNKIKNIGYNKFAAFINSIFPSFKMTASKVKQLLDDLENTLDIVTAFVILYSLNRPTYKLPKKFPATISLSTEKLITSDSSSIVVKEPYSNKHIEISKDKTLFPKGWGLNERILLYDVILREYSMKPRKKIILIQGKKEVYLSSKEKKEFITISPSRAKELTHLDKYSISRIIKSFRKLLDDILIFEGYTTDGKPVFTKRLLMRPLVGKEGIHGIVHGELDIEFYEFTSFTEKLLDLTESNYTIVEAAPFSRLKKAFPTKAQNSAAKLLELIFQTGRNRYLTLEAIASRIGKTSYLKYRKKKAIIEEASFFFETFKKEGIIESYKQNGKIFVVRY